MSNIELEHISGGFLDTMIDCAIGIDDTESFLVFMDEKHRRLFNQNDELIEE